MPSARRGPSLRVVSETRARILDAAAALIAERGLRRTSIDDVVARARLSGKSHFYHYFRSKDELGLEVLSRRIERFADRGLAILRDPAAAPTVRLDRFIDALTEPPSEGDAGPPFGLLAEAADTHEELRERLAAIFGQWAAQLQSLLREARPQLVKGVDTGRLSRFIIAALEGGLMMAKVSRDEEVLRGVAADLKRYLGSHVRNDTAR